MARFDYSELPRKVARLSANEAELESYMDQLLGGEVTVLDVKLIDRLMATRFEFITQKLLDSGPSSTACSILRQINQKHLVNLVSKQFRRIDQLSALEVCYFIWKEFNFILETLDESMIYELCLKASHNVKIGLVLLLFIPIASSNGNNTNSSPLQRLEKMKLKLISIWGSSDFIHHASIDYQRQIHEILYLVHQLQSSLDKIKSRMVEINYQCPSFTVNLPETPKIDSLESYYFQKFFKSIESYLSCARAETREMGFILADTITKTTTAGLNLSEDIDKTKYPTLNIDSFGTDFNIDIVEGALKDKRIPIQSVNKAVQFKESRPKGYSVIKSTPHTEVVQEATKLPIYKFHAKPASDQTPRFIRDCINYVTSSEVEKVELGLQNLALVLKRSSQMELCENTNEIVDTLCGLANEYDLNNFEQLMMDAMVVTVFRDPEISNQILIKHLFSKQFGIMNKIRILKVLNTIPLLLNPTIKLDNWPTAQSDLKLIESHRIIVKPSFYYSKLFLRSIMLNLQDPQHYTNIFEANHNIVLGKQFLVTILIQFYQTRTDLQILEDIKSFIIGFNCMRDFRNELCDLVELCVASGGLDQDVIKLIGRLSEKSRDERVILFSQKMRPLFED